MVLPVGLQLPGGTRWRRARAALTRGITRNVVALGIVSLFNDISSEMLIYLVPLYLTNVLGAPMAIIGTIEGVAESTSALLKLVSGAISDRVGRRKFLVGLGYAASVAGKALLIVAFVWPVVLVARVFDRVGKGIRTAPRDALIADSTAPEYQGVAFGLNRALDTVGAFIGVFAAAVVIWLIERNAVLLTGDAFRTLAILAFVPGVLVLWTIAVGVRDVKRAAPERTAGAGESAVPVARGLSRWRAFPTSFWLYMLATALFTLGNSSDAFLAIRSQQLGLTLFELLLVILAFNATNAIVAWPAGALSDRVGRRWLIAGAWLIYAACYAGFAVAPFAGAVLPLWVLYGTYYALSEGVGKALVADVAPRELRATAYGIMNAIIGVMILPASVIAGILYAASSPAPFLFGAVCAAAAAVLLLVAVRPARPAPRAETSPTVA